MPANVPEKSSRGSFYGADNTPEVEPTRGHPAGERALRTAVPYREGLTEMCGMW